MKAREWSAEEKLAIVLEGLRGQRSVSEICWEHQISSALYYRWRDKFLEAEQKALSNGGTEDEVKVLRAKVEKLEKIIGRQTIAIELLKKQTSYSESGIEGDEGSLVKCSWGLCGTRLQRALCAFSHRLSESERVQSAVGGAT
ncbi:MAG: transposase [Candidatus Aminicenantes bacterium]|nr:transposase [Candidatus Aminicenantes bacterium]